MTLPALAAWVKGRQLTWVVFYKPHDKALYEQLHSKGNELKLIQLHSSEVRIGN